MAEVIEVAWWQGKEQREKWSHGRQGTMRECETNPKGYVDDECQNNGNGRMEVMVRRAPRKTMRTSRKCGREACNDPTAGSVEGTSEEAQKRVFRDSEGHGKLGLRPGRAWKSLVQGLEVLEPRNKHGQMPEGSQKCLG
jgi:hypothetical protein